jgi:hypothetical protein
MMARNPQLPFILLAVLFSGSEGRGGSSPSRRALCFLEKMGLSGSIFGSLAGLERFLIKSTEG